MKCIRRLGSVECFSPGVSGSGRPTWHSVPDMRTPRSNFAAAVLEGKIVVLGGYIEPTVSGKCEVYCPTSNTWSDVPDMQLMRSALSQVVLTWDSMPSLPTILT